MERIIKDKKELVKLVSFLAMCDGGIYRKLNRHGNRNNGQFIMNHTSKEYINYAKQILENLTAVRITERKDYNTDGANRKPQQRLETRALPFYSVIHSRLYRGTYKGLDTHALKMMDAECLAMLYMADGSMSLKGNALSSVLLNTKRLTEGDNLLLSMYIKNIFGIDSTINRGNKYTYIRIKGKSVYKFFNIVKPYILNDFKYKVPNDELLQKYKQDDDIV